MNHIALKLICLFPGVWREHYADEMAALLEQMDLTLFDLIDLMSAAMQAHYDRLKDKLLMNPISRIPIITAVFSLTLIALSLVTGGKISEDAGEFMVVAAIIMVFPAIGALSDFYPRDTPRANHITRRVGQLSGAALSVTLLISTTAVTFSGRQVAPNSALTLLFMAGMMGLSLWFFLNGWLGVRGGVMPVGLGIIGMLVGPLLIVIFITAGNFLPVSTSAADLRSAMNIITPLWLLTFIVWLAWTAAWLWYRRRATSPATNLLTN